MRSPNLIASFTYALQGFFFALRQERNLRIHIALAVLTSLLGAVCNLTRIEWVALVATVTLVLMAELFNTAVEATVNLYTGSYHPVARTAKNVAAAAVLVAAAGAMVIGYLIFFPHLFAIELPLDSWARRLPAHVTSLALVVVTLLVFWWKAGRRPFRLQGGMPSWHTAVAAALGTAILLTSRPGGAVPILAVLLVLLVAESRLEAGIHTLPEVLTGALLGFLVTLLLFQLTAAVA